MNMRLAYRIASMEPVAPNLVDCEQNREVLGLERKTILRSEKIIADNVAKYYYEHDLQEWHAGEDIPNWAPPFPSMFIEYQEPECVADLAHQFGSRPGQAGALLYAEELNKEARQFFFALPQRDSPLSSADRLQWQNALAESKWAMVCSLWGTGIDKPYAGRPISLTVRHFLAIRENGSLAWLLTTMPGGFPHTYGFSILHIVGLTISFMNCKNVTSKPEEIEGRPKWHAQHQIPILKFYTLNINPMKEVLRTEGGSETNGLKKALHICRGHFATYTEERPLFGKHSGTFWVPSHVRGSIEQGAVVKDYKVTI